MEFYFPFLAPAQGQQVLKKNMWMPICCLRHQRAKMCEKGSGRWCSFVGGTGRTLYPEVGSSDTQGCPRSGRAISPHTEAEDMRPAHLLNVGGTCGQVSS